MEPAHPQTGRLGIVAEPAEGKFVRCYQYDEGV
jgi:hypothetical protein